MGEVETEIGVRREGAIGIAVGRRFDLDHPRAEIGQERGGVRSGDEGSALDDGNMIENADGNGILSGANLSRILPACKPTVEGGHVRSGGKLTADLVT